MADTLYVKYRTSDTGARPIPAGEVFWTSPSIFLTDDDGKSLPEAQLGKTNWIHVQVDSMSPGPRSGVRVQVWVCDYTGGYIGPDAARESSGGRRGRRGAVATPITSKDPGVAKVPWIPTEKDLINSPDPTKGHLCVGANVVVEMPPPPEGKYLSGSTTGMGGDGGRLDVVGDRHHGWANIIVVKPAPGIRADVPFRVMNPGPEVAEFTLAAIEREGDEAMGPLAQEHLLMDRCVDLEGGGPPPELIPAACLTEPWERRWLAQGGQLVLRGFPDPVPLRPATNRARFQIVTEESAGEEVRIRIRPGEEVPVVLTIDGTGEVGAVHAIDVMQIDPGGLVLGGGRIIVLQVPEWFC